MILITKDILKDFKKHGKQDIEDPLVICKFFNPMGAGTWYAISISDIKIKGIDETFTIDNIDLNNLKIDSIEDIRFFGHVEMGNYPELGYFVLSELKEFKGRFNSRIERDLYFTQKTLKHFKNN